MIRIQITDGTQPVREDVDFVQVRDPGIETRILAARVRGLKRGGILVNDRIDVALACGAAGVHLRSNSISPALVRKIAPPDFVISVACHSAEDVFRADAEGADYALLAPIFAPLSKVAHYPPLGLDTLRGVTSQVKIPVIVLGGITEDNGPQCIAAGAAGVAGITLFR